MDLWILFDIPHLLRQVGIIALFITVPPILFALLQVRRRLYLTVALLGGFAVLLLLSWLVIADSQQVWGRVSLPITPFPIGPSYLSLPGLLLAAAVAWVPWLLYALASAFRRRERLPTSRDGRRVAILTLYFVCATLWLALGFTVGEYSHEDTVYAERFTRSGWDSISEGMTEAEVFARLGPPLPLSLQPRFPNSTCWVRN